MKKILVIEDDTMFANMLQNFLSRNGFEVSLAHSRSTAEKELAESRFDLVLSDLRLPDVAGLELLRELKRNFDFPVIMMSGYHEIGTAVEAMKLGAADYLTKPLKPEELIALIENALNEVTTPSEKSKPLAESNTVDFIEGDSDVSKRLSQYIDLVGPTDFSVLIEGQSGTGKEIVARRIHAKSARRNEPFIAVDCGAIPKDLASSEFFGHKKGSFTGALQDKIGYFQAADKGTIFLDEIGNLSYEHQIQLLRVLQERKVRPVGASEDISVDIRIMAATNENLRQAIAAGEFREDLFHRLNEFPIVMPSLKERKDDLVLFAAFFLDRVNSQLGKEVFGFSNEVLQVFKEYSWPGNLRELQNVIKRAALLAKGNTIVLNDLPLELLSGNSSTVDAESASSLKDVEKEQILKTLQETGFNKSKAAEKLNINRKTLYNKLKGYGLDL